MYVLIAVLALQAGRTEDGAGALEVLNGGPGKLLLFAMAAGFAAYALWRFADAAFDSEGHGDDKKGLAMRIGGAASGVVHFGLAYIALSMALGGEGSAGSDSTKESARTALDLPGGWLLLLVAALGLFCVGLYQLINAAKASFLSRLDGRAAQLAWVKTAGRIGYTARGIVFVIVAWFVGQAGLEGRAGEAGGMGQALASLPQTMQFIVACGLLLFGLFSFVEARYRRLRDPAQMLHGGVARPLS
jgi:hypothetical protein